jgi:hypothetical protein
MTAAVRAAEADRIRLWFIGSPPFLLIINEARRPTPVAFVNESEPKVSPRRMRALLSGTS